MKCLRFNFSHPVKGHASLMRLSTEKPIYHSIMVDSKKSNLIKIPVNGYPQGKWKIILDWEYDGRNFSHQEVFEIKN